MTTTAQAAARLLTHLTEHGLPEPASLHVAIGFDSPEVRVQVRSRGLADTAAVLLRWADSLPAVTVRAWRPDGGISVHLDVDTTLTGQHGQVPLTVYGGVPFDAVASLGLKPGQARPVSLDQLNSWATAEVAA